MKKTLKIKNRHLGEGYPTYIIAEMSANHGGDLNRAVEIVHAAKEAGADCIKIQTYTADTITIDSDNEYFQIKEGTWQGENLYSLYQKAYTPWEWQAQLKAEAEKIGLDFLSTPFDPTAVDFLEGLGVDFYKIASFEIVDIPLIKAVAATGKPIIMSTGMATLGEIEEAVHAIQMEGNDQLCLLKCSSAYPAIPKDMNLKAIQHLSETFGVPAGLSDHSLGHIAAVTAVALGAKVIEKHFCLNREIATPDSSFSMEPGEFKEMVQMVRAAERAIGEIEYSFTVHERVSRSHRKSIFVIRDLKKGEILSEENIKVIRPAQGLAPKYWEDVLGKPVTQNIQRGTPLNWGMVETDSIE